MASIYTDAWVNIGLTKALVVGTAPAAQQIVSTFSQTFPYAIRIYNASGADVVLGYGTSSANAVTNAAAISTATGGPGHILPTNAVEVISVPANWTTLWAAAYGTGTSGQFFVAPGTGL